MTNLVKVLKITHELPENVSQADIERTISYHENLRSNGMLFTSLEYKDGKPSKIIQYMRISSHGTTTNLGPNMEVSEMSEMTYRILDAASRNGIHDYLG